ncbi:MAG: endolytic transglycosylase MltG [Candidatus Latescibacterota bacterium]
MVGADTPHPRRRTARRLAQGLAVLLGAATVVAGVLYYTWYYLNLPTGLRQKTEVRIPPGTSARGIGAILEERGVIRSATAFAVRVSQRGVAHQLQAGTYELDGTRPVSGVIDCLLSVPPLVWSVTVPEGLTRHEIAGLLAGRGVVDSARFVALSEDPEYARRLGVEAPNLEGYLFPDTYHIDPQATVEAVIEHMVSRFRHVFSDSLQQRLSEVDLTLHEAVTLASIVECEARVRDERPIVSGVFQRRLHLDRKLESCATVAFALGAHKTHLSNEDLLVDSPYNTYRYLGLPPGPISNPGRASILATLYPAGTTYLYFVSRGDGTHVFSRTHEEHEQAKRALRRLQGQQAAVQ